MTLSPNGCDEIFFLNHLSKNVIIKNHNMEKKIMGWDHKVAQEGFF
jgi:hypothetical protein